MKHFLFKELDLAPDVVSLFEKIVHLPGSILLDSGKIMERLARYSFMSADPFMIITSRGKTVRIERTNEPCRVEYIHGELMEIARSFMERYRINDGSLPIPFIGGAAGYFSYDLGRQFESIHSIADNDLDLPDCWLGFYDVVAAVDHVERKVYLASTGFPSEAPEERKHRAKQRIKWLEKMLAGVNGAPAVKREYRDKACDTATRNKKIFSHFSEKSYCEAVKRVKEYIAAGDIFQVNLSQRFEIPLTEKPWAIYKRLREINPAPMASFIDCGFLQVVCASPERFMKVAGGFVETRPIKGTRPRGRTPLEDLKQRDELWNSEKDRAELVMIVDLERNDLGRVCIPGSVRVPELYRLEEYPTVFHLVSTVQGELEPGYDIFDLIAASFPGGSITGAPKKRAMEIIDELEPVRRGVYCGSIGYIGFNGDADLNIVIRTLLFTGNAIYLHVGGGITIDSDPRAEYQETLDKAKALLASLGIN